MIAYVVAHRPLDADLLRRLLPAELCQQVSFVAGGGISGVLSMATTLVADRETPVAIVEDANSVDPVAIQERQRDDADFLKSHSPGIPTTVIMAVPQLESIFFKDPQLLHRLFDGRVTEEILALAKTQPRRALQELIAGPDSISDLSALLAALTPEDLASLRRSDVIQELSDFLVKVRQQTPTVAGTTR
jgi:hypothetical protein